MSSIVDYLKEIAKRNASDLHIVVGAKPMMRLNGSIIPLENEIITSNDSVQYIEELSIITPEVKSRLDEGNDVDYGITLDNNRYRINIFKDKGEYGVVARVINLENKGFAQLGLPEHLKETIRAKKGLILVTGPTGSGKSTTLAAFINEINETEAKRIITIEDPIECVYQSRRSLISQRELGTDTVSFERALKSALRQDPDIIVVGEMRDLDTISIALTAAETGHLVFGTLHTTGAAKTVDRIIDVFPMERQQQIRVQLASVIQAIVSQQLLETKDKTGRVAALEILLSNPAIRNLIREGKVFQIENTMKTSRREGMELMDDRIMELYQTGRISEEVARDHLRNKKLFDT